MLDFIATAFPDAVIKENDRKALGTRSELDIYLPSRQVGVEYNGLFWHDERDPKVKARHASKAAAAVRKGITLVIVWEDDWKARRSEVEEALVAVIRGGPVPDWMTYQRVTANP